MVLANRRCNFLYCSFPSCLYPFFILCPTLPVSLDCPFLIATSALSYIYLYRTDIQIFVVKQKPNILREKAKGNYMTHLIGIYNMFLGSTNHNNECSKKYSFTEVNYSFFVKITNYTLASHSDCIITICELAFYSARRVKKRLEMLTVYLRKTDTT